MAAAPPTCTAMSISALCISKLVSSCEAISTQLSGCPAALRSEKEQGEPKKRRFREMENFSWREEILELQV